MKINVSVAALMAAAGAFSYGSVVRAQGVVVVVPQASTADGLVLQQDENLSVNSGITVSNSNNRGSADAVRLEGTGYLGQRSITVNGLIDNFSGNGFAAITGTGAITDPSQNNVTIDVGAGGVIRSTAPGAPNGESIVLNDNVAVTNSGTISAQGYAVSASSNLTVTNNASSTISSTLNAAILQTSAASSSSTITNNGSISGGQRGIDTNTDIGAANSAQVSIANSGSGTISGTSDAAIDAYVKLDGNASSTLDIQNSGAAAITSGGNAVFGDVNVFGDGNATVSVGNSDTARIQGGAGDGVNLDVDVFGNGGASVQITNNGSGTIYGSEDGIDASLNLTTATTSASVTITNNDNGRISGGEYGVRLDVNGTGPASINVTNSGTIFGEYNSAVSISTDSIPQIQKSGAASVGPAATTITNNGYMSTEFYGPEAGTAVGAITVDTADGSVINNGLINSDARIYAEATHAIRLTGTYDGFGHIINNSGSIEGQPDGRNGAGFNASAVYMVIDDSDQAFNLTVTNGQKSLIGSRASVISASSGSSVSGAYAATSSNISVANAGTMTSDFGSIILNNNQQTESATVSVTNLAGGVLTSQRQIVRSIVDSASGTVSLSVENDGQISNNLADLDGFALIGNTVDFDLRNGQSGTITAQGDLLSTRAFSQNNDATVSIGGNTGFTNDGTLRANGGSILNLTEEGDDVPGGGSVTVTMTNGQTGDMYASQSIVDINAEYAALSLTNSGTLYANNGAVVRIDADQAGAISINNSGSLRSGEYQAILIFATANGEYAGSVTIDNTGEIAAGYNNDAIVVSQDSDAFASVSNSGAGKIQSRYGTAVSLNAYYNSQLSVTNADTAEITGASSGVRISGYGAASIAVTNSGSATITSTGERGINAAEPDLGQARRKRGLAAVAISSNQYTETISVSNQDAATITGEYSNGVDVFADSVGQLTVTNADDASISGYARAVSVQVNSYAQTLTITNEGDVQTTADGEYLLLMGGPVYSGGLVAYAANVGTVSVDNSGSVTSDTGYGIMVSANAGRRLIDMRLNGVDRAEGVRTQPSVTADNSGSISSYETGIQIVAGEYSNATVTNSGDITSTDGHGISISREAQLIWLPGLAPEAEVRADVPAEYAAPTRTVSVANTGSIVADDAGILISPNAYGLFFGGGFGYAASDISVVNGADGTIAAEVGIGIREYNVSAISVVNDGTIQALGDGISKQSLSFNLNGIAVDALFSTGPISVENNGTITSDGNYGISIFAGVAAEDHTISVVNTGDVTAANDSAVDIYVRPGVRRIALGVGEALAEDFATISSVTVDNTGSLTGGAYGVYVNIAAAITNAGDITATAENGVAVTIAGGSITNSGSITGGGFGVVTQGEYSGSNQSVTTNIAQAPGDYAALSALTLENTGTISGGLFGVQTNGDFADTVTNDGGTISGATAALSLDLGDDTVIAKGAAVFTGNVDGGEGTDTLTLDGFTGPSFTPVSFEQVSATNGTNLLLDNVSTFGGGVFDIDASSVIDGRNANNGLTFTTVNNAGRLNLQDGATGDTLAISGDLVSTGTIAVDVDPRDRSQDLVDAGGSADASGTLDVALLTTPIGVSEHVVISGADGATASDLVLNTTDSVISQFALRDDGDDIVLVISADFAPVGLAEDGSAFGAYLNANADDPALEPILALAGQAASVEELQTLFSNLNGIDFSSFTTSAVVGGGSFGNGLFSCAVGEGEFAAIDEGQCGWTRITGSYFDRDASGANPGVEETAFSVSAGGQFIYDDNIRLGAGVGIDIIDTDGSFGLKADATRIHAGVSAKYVEGPMMAGVSVSGGVSFTDSDRTTALGTAKGEFETFDFSVIARAAYLADLGNGVYVKPQIQGGVTYVDRGSFTEKGAGAANLAVSSDSETYFSFSPSIEIGTEVEAEGMTIRPYVRAGVTILSEDNVQTTARLAGAAAATTFTTVTETDNVFGDVAVGATVFTEGDLSVRAEYQGRFADDTMEHGGFIKLQMKF